MRSGPRRGYRWTPENIVYAIELWHRRHLRAPVQRVFGSWNSGIRAAGLKPRRPGEARSRWARARCTKTGRFVAESRPFV